MVPGGWITVPAADGAWPLHLRQGDQIRSHCCPTVSAKIFQIRPAFWIRKIAWFWKIFRRSQLLSLGMSRLASGMPSEERARRLLWWDGRCMDVASDYPEAMSCPGCLTTMWSELLEDPE